MQAEQSYNPRNFLGGLWHGAFLALGMALTQPTTVISSFVADLTGSTVWVGGLSTVLTVSAVLPQIFVARWLEPKPLKMPYLLLGIYLRVFSWGVLAWMIFKLGAEHPQAIAWSLIGMLAIFYAAGGLANIPYSDIIGKVIPPTRRGAFFGGKQALAGPLAVVSALAAKKVLAEWDYPDNYALLFGLAAVALGIASFGFLVMREPAGEGAVRKPLPWRSYLVQLRGGSQRLRLLVVVELLTGFSLMVLPFYVVYARQKLDAPAEAVGWFLLAQVIGGVLANLIWARLVDRLGSRTMVFWCASTSTLTPILAIILAPLGWQAMMVVFFLAGAAFDGRKVGFQSSLLELAPPPERPTYFALNEVLILPLAFLSLGAGIFLEYFSYTSLFILAAIFIGGGALMAWRWKGIA